MTARFACLAVWLCLTSAGLAQEGFSLFTTDFPAEEFAARRGQVYQAIGDGLALVQGAPSPPGYSRFRQSNEFYYLSGIEVPHAYLLLDGASARTTLYLPHRNEARERSEGKVLSAEDAEELKQLSGVDAVFGTEMLGEHLAARRARAGPRACSRREPGRRRRDEPRPCGARDRAIAPPIRSTAAFRGKARSSRLLRGRFPAVRVEGPHARRSTALG